MLKQGNKSILILALICFFSCQLKNEEDQTHIYIRKSTSVIGQNNYNTIYKAINDSINLWIDNKLGYYQYLKTYKKYLVDSIICFNTKGDKLICALLQQQLLKEGVADDIDYFYGVKINTQWFFFSGPNIFIPRDMYKQPTNKPLSFSKLHEIAMKEVYRGYLLTNGEINDAFFSDLTSGAWCSKCKTEEEWNNAYLKQVNDNWKLK